MQAAADPTTTTTGILIGAGIAIGVQFILIAGQWWLQRRQQVHERKKEILNEVGMIAALQHQLHTVVEAICHDKKRNRSGDYTPADDNESMLKNLYYLSTSPLESQIAVHMTKLWAISYREDDESVETLQENAGARCLLGEIEDRIKEAEPDADIMAICKDVLNVQRELLNTLVYGFRDRHD